MEQSTHYKSNGAPPLPGGVAAQAAPKSDRYWDDEEFQDQLTYHLVFTAEVLERCASLLCPEDFRPLHGMHNGRERWIVAERALEHYEKHGEPLGKMLRADVLAYSKHINLGASQIGALEEYCATLGKLKLSSTAFVTEKVLAFKSQHIKAAAIQELMDLQVAGALTDEKWKELSEQALAHNIGTGWPKPEPLANELPPVEAFSLELLPTSFRGLVQDISNRMQVPMDFVAPLLVVALAGAVNRRAIMQPKRNDTSFRVVPNLWGGIIGQSGFMKSPVLKAVCASLRLIEKQWQEGNKEALKKHQQEADEYELRHTAWREQYKSALKKKGPTDKFSEDEPEKPKAKHLIINDNSWQKVQEIMSANPAGVTMIRDELIGWLSQLDTEGREGERGFYLTAWSGDDAYDVGRIGRGEVLLPHCCLSLLGSITPSRLRTYLMGDAASLNDGLIQRFQLLVWPDTTPHWRYVDEVPQGKWEKQVAGIFERLVALDPETPTQFRFGAQAQKLYVEWLAGLEAKIRSGNLHPELASHLSKYRSLMPSLAVLFELADRVAAGKPVAFKAGMDPYREVFLEHAEQAVRWCSYLESHAARIYSCVMTPQLRAARELAAKIREPKVASPFRYADVYLKGWSCLDSPEIVKKAVETLEAIHWVKTVSALPGPQGGRPSVSYDINPEVYSM